MARVTFRLPDIGEGIAEAEIVAWHFAIGDMVDEDAPLADMMTDKATVEMSAPVSGKLVEIAGAVGDQVPIGAALAVFETGEEAPLGDGPAAPDAVPPEGAAVAEATSTFPPPHSHAPFIPSEVEGPAPDGRTSTALGTNGEGAGSSEAETEPGEGEMKWGGEAAAAKGRRVLASPAVRKRAAELSIDLATIRPAHGERVRHADLDAHLRYGGGAATPRAATPDHVEEIRIVGLRRKIAENMALSKRTIPHFAYVEECDVTALEALRAAMNAGRGDRPKLSLLPFLITAIARAVPAFPMVNARYDDAAGIVRRHAAVHLGLATQTDAGLTVPVIRDAQARDVWALAGEIARLADAVRSGKAARDALSGSTITLTSLGALGGIVSTPVINKPEVAIVGVNRIVERPAVIEGRIEVRKLMNLSSSFDHRVVDGMDAARFIQAVRRLIELPALLFAP